MAKGRTYTREFKLDPAPLLNTSGKSRPQVPRDLGIPASCLWHWKKKRYGEEGADAFPGRARLKPKDEAVRQLRRELEIARQERDI